MTASPPLEDRLAHLGQARAQDPPADERKRGIKARLFGDPAPRRRIGRFIDLGLLGRGAMGTVRRAYDERLAREVAIKLVLHRSRRHDERLIREAQALAQLSHPNVVQVYEVGEAEDEIFIAMELVDGVTLHAWQREPRSWRECLDVYLQAGRGLAAAHAKGLVHRDFKPSNCIRDPQGRVRVLDFGLARAVELTEAPASPSAAPAASTALTAPSTNDPDGSAPGRDTMLRARITADHAVVGTIAYIAPEQFAGRRADAQSDQFSFCVALHEALYGELPFGTNPRGALVEMLGGVDQRPALPSTHPPVPRALRRVLQRGLAAGPEARWPSMDALLRQLERPLRHTLGRRLAMLAVVVGTTATATAALMDDDPCHDRARLDEVWGEVQRHDVREALMATGAPYADDTWATVERELDAYAGAWEDASLATCRASLRTPDPAAGLSAQRRCLGRRRASLEYRVEVLSRADDGLVGHAAEVVAELPSIEGCTGLHEPPPGAPSPRDDHAAEAIEVALDRARTLDAAARYDEGLSVVATAIADAEALGYEPLRAEARLAEGHLQLSADQLDEAEVTLQAASTLALQHGTDEVVVEASALLSHVVGNERARAEQGLLHATLAVDLAERPGVSPTSRAMAHTSYGNLATLRGELGRAQHHYERALEILEREHGEDHLALVAALDGLATALRGQGELALALERRERALAIHRRWQGDQHPATALTQANLASILYDQGEHARARRSLEQAIATLEQTLGADHSALASPHNGLAAVLAKQGDPGGAEREYREAIRIWERTLGPAHLHVATARLGLAGLLGRRGETDAAIGQLETVVEALGRNQPTPQTALRSAQALRDLGRLRFDRGDRVEAEARYRQGVELLEREGADRDPMMASLLNGLGHVVLERGDAPQAEALHLRAKSIYEAVHGTEHLKVGHTHLYLGRASSQQQQWDRAEAQVERALEIYAAQEQPVDDEHFADARRLRDRIADAR